MIYNREVRIDSPLHYWRMDDASGTTMTATVGTSGTYTGSPSLQQPGAIRHDANSPYAVKFNGTTQFAQAALDLTAVSRIAVEFWLYWTSNATDDKLALEFGNSNYFSTNGFIVDPNSASGVVFGMGDGGPVWADAFTRPTANAWHHWVLDMNRTTPLNIAYIDGVSQSLTLVQHDASGLGTYANETLNVMCRAGASLFCPANSLMDELALYSGGLSAARVQAHYQAGVSPPLTITANRPAPFKPGNAR